MANLSKAIELTIDNANNCMPTYLHKSAFGRCKTRFASCCVGLCAIGTRSSSVVPLQDERITQHRLQATYIV